MKVTAIACLQGPFCVTKVLDSNPIVCVPSRDVLMATTHSWRTRQTLPSGHTTYVSTHIGVLLCYREVRSFAQHSSGQTPSFRTTSRSSSLIKHGLDPLDLRFIAAMKLTDTVQVSLQRWWVASLRIDVPSVARALIERGPELQVTVLPQGKVQMSQIVSALRLIITLLSYNYPYATRS